MENPNTDPGRTPAEDAAETAARSAAQGADGDRYAANELSVAERQVNILRDKLRHIDRQLAAATQNNSKLVATLEAAKVQHLLKPFPTDKMQAWPVSTEVNKVAADGPHLLRPIALPANLGLA